jgi:hypothetical protein
MASLVISKAALYKKEWYWYPSVMKSQVWPVTSKFILLFSHCRHIIKLQDFISLFCLIKLHQYQFYFFLIRIVEGGVHTGSTRHIGHWMTDCTCPGWLWCWRIWWNEDWQGKPKYSEKTCPRATLSHHKSHLPDPGSNPGRRGGKPATNWLSCVAAFHYQFICILKCNVFFNPSSWLENHKFSQLYI